MPRWTRRDALRRLSCGALAASASLKLADGASADTGVGPGALRLGLIADVHQDVMHDAPERLRRFVEWAVAEGCDGILQLGDFCIPKPENRDFLNIWDSFKGPRFHVLGNHDMDGGYSREQAVAFLGMPQRYYSQTWRGWRLIVLDANDRPPDHRGGYPAYVAADQLEWLGAQLEQATEPVLVFSHQSLERPPCIVNQAEIRRLIAGARRTDGRRKVAACFHGHWHIDHTRLMDGVPYVHLNSASYYWMGDAYARKRYADDIHARHPWIDRVAPYRDPLFARLDLDPVQGTLKLSGRGSAWVGPSPVECGLNPADRDCEPDFLVPEIRSREFSLPRAG